MRTSITHPALIFKPRWNTCPSIRHFTRGLRKAFVSTTTTRSIGTERARGRVGERAGYTGEGRSLQLVVSSRLRARESHSPTTTSTSRSAAYISSLSTSRGTSALPLTNASPSPSRRSISALSTSALNMTSSQPIQPVFAANYDQEQGRRDLVELLVPTGEVEIGGEGGGKWTLTPNGKGIERTFRFKTFGKTWEFMTHIATHAKTHRHHPEWSNLYNVTFIRWTTHSPSGLSPKDVIMARICDEVALACGEIVTEKKDGETQKDGVVEEGAEGNVERRLVDRVVKEGGGCCIPKARQ